MPPPWSAIVASTASRRDDRHLRRRAACHHLVEVELSCRRLHLAVRIAGEFLAHEIGAVESIVHLLDGRNLEPADDAQIFRSFRGAERVSMVSFRDGSWLTITPEGFFDASS
jgi:hypothetical protein